jgi:hypothetical protein
MSTWWTILGSAGVLTAKLHNQRHTALTVASKLEDFARRCEVTIADATRALDEAFRLVDYEPLPQYAAPVALLAAPI